ncbi:hypothetical protein FRB95_011170 [Tulasnella sp. JGI-2019a]|nr:hypothetical protein FRB95_011170 [Tulasnella sp. JGI-2019a]
MEYAHWHVEKWQNDGLDIQHDAPTDDDGDEETRMMSAAFRVEHRRSRYASEMEGSKRPRLVCGLRMLGDVTVTLPLGAAAIALLECLRLLIDVREAFMQQAWPTDGATYLCFQMSSHDPLGGPNSVSPKQLFNGGLYPDNLRHFMCPVTTYATEMMDHEVGGNIWETDRGGGSAADEVDKELDIVVGEEGSRDAPMLTEYAMSARFNGHLVALGGPTYTVRWSLARTFGNLKYILTLTPFPANYSSNRDLCPRLIRSWHFRRQHPQSGTQRVVLDIGQLERKMGNRRDLLYCLSAPTDHAFLGKTNVWLDNNRGVFMVKLLKEYRMPSSCLPDSITLCAYEDCTDLLRSLIMDPEGAVCEGAPFVIDWFLDKTFPQTPPIAHFQSWTNGNGCVNPDLYEKMKVCLSILGT